MEVKTVQVAVEIQAGFDAVVLKIEADGVPVIREQIRADALMPGGTAVGRIDLHVANQTANALTRICLELAATDQTDGYYLVDGRGEHLPAACIERGSEAWSSASVWGEGKGEGYFIRLKVGGGMLE